jgi:hypothetical protein
VLGLSCRGRCGWMAFGESAWNVRLCARRANLCGECGIGICGWRVRECSADKKWPLGGMDVKG